jgi:peptidyl-prolyl cis-trans isomerase C
MKRSFPMKKKGILIPLTLILLAGFPGSGTAEDPSGFVATVNGVGVQKGEFERSWASFLRQKGIPPNHAEKSGQVDEFRLELVNLLVDQELLYQEAARGGHGAAAEQVEAEMAKARGQFPSEAEFEKALAGSGLDAAGYSRYLERRISVLNMVRQRIAPSVSVSPEEIADFYASNRQSFVVPEQIRARHILIKLDAEADDATREAARKKIEELIAKAKGGADFAELAKEHSQGPSAPRGGDLGAFPRGKMVPPFEEAAFALQPGEVSAPVLTRFGYHAIKVEERQAEKTVSQEEAAGQITSFLQEKKTAEATQELLKSLRAEAKIEMMFP